jgi:hypothetical protein
MDEYHVQFEDGSHMKLKSRQIAKMCRHMPSWGKILGMASGSADHAIIRIRAANHQARNQDEKRAAVFMRQPPDNWKFPETAV